MEKLRLETELGWQARRRGRLGRRLQEIQEVMGKRLLELQQELPEAALAPTPPAGQNHPPEEVEADGVRWRSMTIGY
jgi:hypothetical protein